MRTCRTRTSPVRAESQEKGREEGREAEAPQKTNEEKMAELIQRGKKAGKLSSKEISDVLDGMNLDSDQMDKFYNALDELGIELEGEALPALDDDELLPALEALEEIEGVTEEEIDDTDSSPGTFSRTDPVQHGTSRRSAR